MMTVAIDFDLSGYAYDPDNPTREAELLCRKLNTIIDNLSSAGAEIRMKEDSDITDAETYIKGVFDSYLTPPDNPPEVETPSNTSMLLDNEIYNAINQARVAWLQKTADKVDETDESTFWQQVVETMKLMLTQENILYLSDGTPIYGKTGAIA